MQKKFLLLILLVLILTFYSISSGTTVITQIIAAFNEDLKIVLNGQPFVTYDENGKELKPIIYDGRTYLPIKALAKALNATVDWVPEKNTITITHNDSTLGIPYKDDEDDDKKGEDDDKKSTSPSSATYVVPVVSAKVENGKIIVSWNKISTSTFEGYKVVASIKNSKPAYPADGYAAYITDDSTTSFEISNSTYYNNGDLGGKFISGQKYYISVTALYHDKKIPGNVVEITMP